MVIGHQSFKYTLDNVRMLPAQYHSSSLVQDVGVHARHVSSVSTVDSGE